MTRSTRQSGPPEPAHASRLAPSPTGALHLGNARTFLVNRALARARGWKLWLRIEDLDTPRVKPGAVDGVLRGLEWLGIDWDPWGAAPPARGWLLQSDDLEPYRAAMRRLAAAGLAYPCVLSRSQIEAAASAPQEGAHDTPFPAGLRPAHAGAAFDFDALNAGAGEADGPNWRLLVRPGQATFTDAFAGAQSFDVSRIIGDFVLWTRRGQPSYQLAVVVDDARQGVTQVVRGADLTDSAARQLLLYRLLGLAPEPVHTHLPLVLGPDGRRLAKRHGDTRIDHYRERGVPAEAVIGLISKWCGLTSPDRPPPRMSSAEFMAGFDLTTMPAGPARFTPEDDEWLLSNARRSS
jgi:glutamyl-tRNA synthetase